MERVANSVGSLDGFGIGNCKTDLCFKY